ncbi:MAG: hypothetical protein NTW53_12090 [Burkholderiales bacterium]|nr:hypothetical protein [Burkholderiales bacterium]
MFEGIKSFIRETRIRFDYPRFESEQTMAHRAEAERRFDIGQLQREVAQIKDQARLAGDQRFGDEITSIRRKTSVLERDIERNLEQLAVFDRNYKSELDDLYAQKKVLFQSKEDLLTESKRLRDERSQAHKELDEAYEDLEEAKSDVDRWYSKSERTPWLFGNAGNKLPKHSMFGQSFGDLEAAKSRRGDAVDEIGDCKRQLNSAKAAQSVNRAEIDRNRVEIGKVIQDIAEVKAARQRMFDLKNDGVQPGILRQTLRQLQSSKASLEEELLTLERRRSALVEETEIRMGVREREAAIADLLARKKQFLDAFHSEQSKAARQDRHRRQWMETHRYDASK